MGEMWKRNILRIIRDETKELPTFKMIKRCQMDMQKNIFGSPACYQAWKDINALSKIQSTMFIHKSVRITVDC